MASGELLRLRFSLESVANHDAYQSEDQSRAVSAVPADATTVYATIQLAIATG